MKTLSVVILACLLAPLASAQERTAGGSLGNQMTWVALKDIADQANGNAKNAKLLAEAIKTCGVKGMLYSPGTSGADAQGCKVAAAPATPKNCEWYSLPQGSHTLTCPSQKVMIGMAYEGATWSNAKDNHAAPEIYAAQCCSLQ